MADPNKGEIVVHEDGTQLIRDASGELVPLTMETPSHGKGQLRRGNPGNSGGGRKPDAARRYFLDLLQCAQDEAEKRLDPEKVANMSDQDLAKFIDVFGKYSVGTKHTLTGPDDGPVKHGIMVMPPLEAAGGETSGDDS